MIRLTRRELLATSAIAATTNAFALEKEPTAISPVDAHVHVWTSETSKFPLAEGYRKENMNPKSFTPEELFAECKPHGVKRIVLIQMSYYQFDNSYMLHAMEKYPGVFGGVAIVDHSQKHVARKMKELARRGVRGFRLYANQKNVANWESSAGVKTMWKTGADENLAMCLLADPDVLPTVHKMCERFPQTPVVIDHFARIGMNGEINQKQLDQLLALSKFKTAFVKTSAFYALGKKQPPYLDLAPMIRQLRDAFGAERLMWATDCPYQVQNGHSYKASIEFIRDRIDFLSHDEKRCILETTAAKRFFE